jgi:GTP-binding protein
VEKDTHTAAKFIDSLRYQAKFLNFAPALTVSALTGQRVVKLFKLVDQVFDQYCRRIGTGRLNKIIESAVEKNTPALHRGRRIKIFYTTQVSSRPPTIVCFSNHPQAVHFSYQRYLVNRIRQETGLDKIPIRIIFRKREGRKGRQRA